MAVEMSEDERLNRRVVQSKAVIAARLKKTREVLVPEAAVLCRVIKCSPSRWSNYESGERRITLQIADKLCDHYSLTLDWIYRGNPARLPHDLVLKLQETAVA